MTHRQEVKKWVRPYGCALSKTIKRYNINERLKRPRKFNCFHTKRVLFHFQVAVFGSTGKNVWNDLTILAGTVNLHQIDLCWNMKSPRRVELIEISILTSLCSTIIYGFMCHQVTSASPICLLLLRASLIFAFQPSVQTMCSLSSVYIETVRFAPFVFICLFACD